MFRRFFLVGLLVRLLVSLLLIGGLVAGGVLLYHTGFTNGYNTAASVLAAGGKTGVAPLPYNGYLPYGPGFGYPFFSFWPLGLCLGVGLFFLVIFSIGGFFRMWGRRHWASQPGMAGFGQHGPAWFRDWETHHPGGPGETPKQPL